jgi:hypothetical protein
MRKRYALDANVLASIVNSDDVAHFSCYSFFRNHHDDDNAIWVVPGLIFFEFQATQSKLSRKRRSMKVHELKLYDKFSLLGGADLLYACMAYAEKIPLVSNDSDFDPYSKELTLVKPRDVMKRTGKVTLKTDDKIYTVGYEEVKDGSGGTVRLDTGQATHVGGLTAKIVAQHLLREIIDSGLADKLELGRPHQSMERVLEDFHPAHDCIAKRLVLGFVATLCVLLSHFHVSFASDFSDPLVSVLDGCTIEVLKGNHP